jgi:hypothetical protein
MIRSYERLVLPLRALLAVALVCLLGPAVMADNVVFRNECRSSVVVQTAVVVKGVLQRDQPQLLRPGDYTEQIPTSVDRLVTIYDARSNRVLFREVLKASKVELGYSILPDPQAAGKVRLMQRNRAGMKGP